MGRKVIAALICGVITFSLVSCKSKTEKVETITPKAKIEERTIEGTWGKDYTKDEIMSFHNTIINRVEDLTKIYELDYKPDEVIKTENNGERVISNEIYLENENAEPNRLTEMDYSYKIYGSDSSEGQIILKVGFNLDGKAIKEAGSFNFAETSVAAYSEAVTGVSDRDYTDLNNRIYAVVNGDSTENTIENNLDGMLETISINDDYILYKLETKRYNFKK